MHRGAIIAEPSDPGGLSVKSVKLLAAAALVVLVALCATTVAAAQSDDDKVVFTVGLTQDLDTPNPTVVASSCRRTSSTRSATPR